MNPRIRTWLNYPEVVIPGEVNNLPSETQPNDVMSIKEMLARHLSGAPVNGSPNPGSYYPEDVGYVPHPSELDLVDRKEYARYFAQYAQSTRETLEELSRPKQPAASAAQSAAGDRPQMSGGQTSAPTSTNTPPAATSSTPQAQ